MHIFIQRHSASQPVSQPTKYATRRCGIQRLWQQGLGLCRVSFIKAKSFGLPMKSFFFLVSHCSYANVAGRGCEPVGANGDKLKVAFSLFSCLIIYKQSYICFGIFVCSSSYLHMFWLCCNFVCLCLHTRNVACGVWQVTSIRQNYKCLAFKNI